MKYFLDILSHDDAAADFIAWSAGLSVLTVCGVAVGVFVRTGTCDLQALGVALAAVIGAAGAVRVARERSKP